MKRRPKQTSKIPATLSDSHVDLRALKALRPFESESSVLCAGSRRLRSHTRTIQGVLRLCPMQRELRR